MRKLSSAIYDKALKMKMSHGTRTRCQFRDPRYTIAGLPELSTATSSRRGSMNGTRLSARTYNRIIWNEKRSMTIFDHLFDRVIRN